jgi:hypothetical protein
MPVFEKYISLLLNNCQSHFHEVIFTKNVCTPAVKIVFQKHKPRVSKMSFENAQYVLKMSMSEIHGTFPCRN